MEEKKSTGAMIADAATEQIYSNTVLRLGQLCAAVAACNKVGNQIYPYCRFEIYGTHMELTVYHTPNIPDDRNYEQHYAGLDTDVKGTEISVSRMLDVVEAAIDERRRGVNA